MAELVLDMREKEPIILGSLDKMTIINADGTRVEFEAHLGIMYSGDAVTIEGRIVPRPQSRDVVFDCFKPASDAS